MKTVVKLIIINLLLTQIVAPLLMLIPCVIYLFFTTGTLNMDALMQMLIIPAQLAGQVMMIIYLWKAGYISTSRTTWSLVSVPFLLLSVIAIFTGGLVVSELTGLLKGIPDIVESTFDILLSGWGGLLAIVLIGPIVEELLFRGAITRILLQRYPPTTAIVVSALTFGILHINPAQIIPAFFIGILLAWIYYKTASLVPCILMHVLNNSLSICFMSKYPEAENVSDLLSGVPYYIMMGGAVLILAIALVWLNRTAGDRPRKEFL